MRLLTLCSTIPRSAVLEFVSLVDFPVIVTHPQSTPLEFFDNAIVCSHEGRVKAHDSKIEEVMRVTSARSDRKTSFKVMAVPFTLHAIFSDGCPALRQRMCLSNAMPLPVVINRLCPSVSLVNFRVLPPVCFRKLSLLLLQ